MYYMLVLLPEEIRKQSQNGNMIAYSTFLITIISEE